MAKITKVTAFGLLIVGIVLALGAQDGAKAQPSAQDAQSNLASGTIYPAGGSDGPPGS